MNSSNVFYPRTQVELPGKRLDCVIHRPTQPKSTTCLEYMFLAYLDVPDTSSPIDAALPLNLSLSLAGKRAEAELSGNPARLPSLKKAPNDEELKYFSSSFTLTGTPGRASPPREGGGRP
ncbi:hypothetical protein IF2G_10630 [Cordyceps javanica]|nr:hypothetical protein IF2G_10630 [Cordyceps javanica]